MSERRHWAFGEWNALEIPHALLERRTNPLNTTDTPDDHSKHCRETAGQQGSRAPVDYPVHANDAESFQMEAHSYAWIEGSFCGDTVHGRSHRFAHLLHMTLSLAFDDVPPSAAPPVLVNGTSSSRNYRKECT